MLADNDAGDHVDGESIDGLVPNEADDGERLYDSDDEHPYAQIDSGGSYEDESLLDDGP